MNVFKPSLLILSFLFPILFSCKKEAPKDLVGTWKLLDVMVASQCDQFDTLNKLPRESFSSISYTSVNTGGIFKFAADSSLLLSGIYFSSPVDLFTHYTILQNGVKTTEGDSIYFFSAAPRDINTRFEIVGADSVYIPGGLFKFYGKTLALIPEKFNFDLQGNKLTLTAAVGKDSIAGSHHSRIYYKGIDVVHLQKY